MEQTSPLLASLLAGLVSVVIFAVADFSLTTACGLPEDDDAPDGIDWISVALIFLAAFLGSFVTRVWLP